MATFSNITSPGSTINFLAGQYGALFNNTAGVSVTITAVSRRKANLNTQVHAGKLYDRDTEVQLDAVSVNMTGPAVGTDVYATLTAPLVVASGKGVYILWDEDGTVDVFYGPSGQTITIGDIGTFEQASRLAGVLSHVASANKTYGPINFQFSDPIPSWTYNSGTNTLVTNGNWYQMRNAAGAAAADPVTYANSTISFPTGSYTWGMTGTSLVVPAGCTVAGQGSGVSTVTAASDCPSGYGSGLIRLSTNSTARGMQIIGSSIDFTVAFTTNTGAAYDWRTTDIKLTQGSQEMLFFYDNATTTMCRGLIDNCYITGFDGQSEMVYSRGPATAWDNVSGIGDRNAIYIEACTFVGAGYICDANANGAIVIRKNTILSSQKADGHGLSSNTPAQGVRRLEVYDNDWPASVGIAIEARGGTNILINNRIIGSGAFYLRDYGYVNQTANFGNVFQTPNNYPIGYQIGTGKRITLNATSIVNKQMVRILTINDGIGGSNTNYTLIGAPDNNIGTQFIATGPGTGTGTVTTTPAATEPSYVIGNTRDGSPITRTYGFVDPAAITLYGSGFSDWNLIKPNRDFFANSTFDTSTDGARSGTFAQLQALTPSVNGYGFWVTDRGNWNTTLPANTSGELWVWNGGWSLYYTPLQYPHPLRGPINQINATTWNTTNLTIG